MSEQFSTNPIACAVCGRSLLPGERAFTYVTRDGAEAEVCELCRARAEAGGWMLPDEAAAARRSGAGRERRRPRGERFNELLTKVREGASSAAAGGRTNVERSEADQGAAEAEASRSPAPEPPGSRAEPRREPRPRRRPPAERDDGAQRPVANTGLEGALRAFNQSEHRRTVAGLGRTLGAPRASGIAVRTDAGASGYRLTVAWEITWYQWEVEPRGRGLAVRELGRGDTIEELRAADRKWNLGVSSDGTLGVKARTRRAPAAAPNA